MNLTLKNKTQLLIYSLIFVFFAKSSFAQQTGKFTYQGKEINLPPGAKFTPKQFKYIDYSEKLNSIGNCALKKDFMSDFSNEDMYNFKTKYQKDYAYYQVALAYFEKLSNKVNKTFTVKELWYIYIYDQKLKNKLLDF